MLRARLATAAVAIPLLLAIIFLAPMWGWGALVVVVAMLAIVEYLRLAFADRPGPRVLGTALGAAVVLAAVSARSPGVWVVASLAAVLPVAMSYVVLARRDLAAALADVGAIAVGVLYGGLLLPHFFWLRALPDGAAWVTFVIAIGMAGDTGGYFVGHALGRRKLIPHLSPGKTVEGALGIVAASLLCAALAKLVLFPQRGFAEILLLGALMSVIGQLGDLSESVMKRVFGAKESGALFPGHGGVLDRIDSLLFPLVLVYYYLLATGLAVASRAC
ncbi:phosphatidate cytidylyltransferase [bacterium]|nr:phosphatidate cytidylyltransferase [bacterium]